MTTAQPAKEQKEVKSNSGFVTVGCKLPHGLHLDIQDDGKPRKRVTVAGTNAANIVGGYGITRDVPADHFNEWMKRNANHPAVVNKLIFAHSEAASTRAQASEMAKARSGFEPMDPDKPGASIAKLTKD